MISELYVYKMIIVGFLSSSLFFFIILMFVTAPYGRFVRKGWGPRLSNKIGWILMELPALLLVIILFLVSDRRNSVSSITFLLLWVSHYGFRSLIYPFLIRSNKRMSLSIVLLGALFNVFNGYIQGRWLFTFAPPAYYSAKWFYGWQFILGIALFFGGMIINRHSDYILRNLRAPGETDYKIPYGGLFNYVSAPNYLGEIIQWIGWAIATWSVAGLTFAIWTIANLLPRAIASHKWYKKTFDNYPETRKAIFPFLL